MVANIRHVLTRHRARGCSRSSTLRTRLVRSLLNQMHNVRLIFASRHDDKAIRIHGGQANRPSYPDPVLSPGRRSALVGPIAWGLCPLARRKGSQTLDRDGLPSLPRGCVFLTLAKSFDPLVQAG